MPLPSQITDRESAVRSYSRSFPVTFAQASGSHLVASDGDRYLDLLAGAGTLNYGHNPPVLKEALLSYLSDDPIVHGLDMATEVKVGFIRAFEDHILQPRGLDYKIQFTGPTGTNAVEAALKIARHATGRNNILAFTNGFHGVTAGSLHVTGNTFYHEAGVLPRTASSFLPYDGYLGDSIDTLEVIERMLEDGSSGVDLPAAAIVETVQGEGGVNVASMEWLEGLQALCKRYGILLIIDDIQMGCGRTGSFFSFSDADLEPDIVTLSKSLSGFGLPMSLVLLRPELDQWRPGQHNGTFRGHNLAFATAAKAIEEFWSDSTFADRVQVLGALLEGQLTDLIESFDCGSIRLRGRCMVQGIDLGSGERASKLAARAFEEKVIIETSGSNGEVVKFLPPLNTDHDDLLQGIDVVGRAIRDLLDGETAAERRRYADLVDSELASISQEN